MNTTPFLSSRSAPETVSWTLLSPGTTRAWNQARGLRIEVEAGRIWLTEEGDSDDHFLSAGESHLVDGDGRVVIEADDGQRPVRVRCTPRAAGSEADATPHGAWVEVRPARVE